MSKILFICSGNVARSQMGEAIYNNLTGTHDAISAGTEAILGKPIHDDVLRVLKHHNLDSSKLFRKAVDEDLFNSVEQVILMTNKSLPSYIKESSKVIVWDVPDPRDKGDAFHESVFQKIQAKVKEFVTAS